MSRSMKGPGELWVGGSCANDPPTSRGSVYPSGSRSGLSRSGLLAGLSCFGGVRPPGRTPGSGFCSSDLEAGPTGAPAWRLDVLFTERILVGSALSCVAFYRRHLTHWHPGNKALFITWRLHQSILYEHCLARPEIAEIVINAILYADNTLRQYDLYAWVVMSNHVHVLVHPLVEPSVFLKTLKNFTARQANARLDRTGSPFWQHESFDHWVRNPAEFDETVGYIETNPVRAGLVERPQDYRWSSAARMSGLEAGPTSAGPTSAGPTSAGATSAGPTSTGPQLISKSSPGRRC